MSAISCPHRASSNAVSTGSRLTPRGRMGRAPHVTLRWCTPWHLRSGIDDYGGSMRSGKYGDPDRRSTSIIQLPSHCSHGSKER